ncbi:MAG: fibronectin type III domain-containing protein, partial [Bacteroidota bacterium]|nr:fibronectin type III domain-containing protein [Bacteroidota bacterium]
MKPLKFLAILSTLLAFSSLPAQVSKDAVVQIEVSIGTSPRSLILNWPVDARATVYNVYRRLKGAKGWGTAKKLAATASQYIDSTITTGTIYEYRVTKTLKIGTATATAIGYTESGIEIPPVGDRGKLILLVDKTYAGDLANELYRLEQDLWNDGWKVIRHDVGRTDLVPDVKAIVANDYNNDPDNTKALFIFGHVPVPYSGFLNPDGHPDHFGAWPADVYYGEFDSGDWPDDATLYHDSLNIYQSGPTTFDTALVRQLNRNKTGDGKFDYTQLPGPIYLMIGRVDLFNMPSFTKSEKELLKQYLDKDHAFRTGTLTVPNRALLEDDFGYFGGEAFASSGWRNLTPLVGADSIQEFNPGSGDWIPVISTKPFLWAYGCGGGWDQGAGGAGSTGEFANSGEEAIFTMLFGSYFGDWGTTDNFLRAPLCTSYGLSCAWSGRPYWQFFPMGLCEPLGY